MNVSIDAVCFIFVLVACISILVLVCGYVMRCVDQTLSGILLTVFVRLITVCNVLLISASEIPSCVTWV